MDHAKDLIILVDDNPSNLRIGKNVLSDHYAVATAPSAEKMFDLLKNNIPALILLDIDMPEMDGLEAIKILKLKPETKDIPVIFLTAKNESEDELEGLSQGAVDYISKPFQPSLLLKRIELHLLLVSQRKILEKQTKELQYFNNHLRKVLSAYLSGDVVEAIIADPKRLQLGGVKKYMTVLFTDLENFSSIAEGMNPEDVIHLLNHYLSAMSDVILTENGTIDKFEGDAIITFFGAPLELPDHALRACKSAILMKRLEAEMNKKLIEQGISPLPLFTRIGINTGEMVVGNMGTDRKMNYTVIGNPVNIASRLEGVNKRYGTWILTTDETLKECGDAVFSRRLDRVRVAGIKEPLQIFEVLELLNDATSEMKKWVALFHEALDIFETRNWSAAAAAFERVLEQNSDEAASLVYLDRCRRYLEEPPAADWDGVFDFNVK